MKNSVQITFIIDNKEIGIFWQFCFSNDLTANLMIISVYQNPGRFKFK